ncbi:Panacea domain-containing protein [Dawidia soli]|uniref:DUF4065 domain-containing protein n=1 Tax=Dawidia soli TaxID=2782352 RepID=A0AAP2DBZ9_9BACT|nr:type II toxin-antitoxin system antitoxin SocA domain-containing protein [Dawidia soli]MBT1689238.1 DUF4065 domain-containing protein [Dawidia soli]
MYKPLAVANFFIEKSLETGVELTPMKLVKLLYIAHGWYLGLAGRPLLTEAVQAWKYGPVVMSIYHVFKKYGDRQIMSLESDLDGRSMAVPTVEDAEMAKFLNRIWDVYKGYSGPQLSTLTHEAGSPWDITWNKNGGKHQASTFIPNDLIATFYRQKGEENNPRNSTYDSPH